MNPGNRRLSRIKGTIIKIAAALALLPIVMGAAEVQNQRHHAWVDEQDRSGRSYSEFLHRQYLASRTRIARRDLMEPTGFHRIHRLRP